jgi:hypothetical protein
LKIPFLIAGPRSVTAVFAQICFYEVTLAIDLAGLSQIHLPATDPSCAATSSASTLISVGCQHALPSYTKIHSAALAAPPPDISRGFLPWRLSDAGLGPSRSAAIGRHPKPSTIPDSSATLIPALKTLLNRIEISFDHCIENRRTTKSGERNWVNQFRSPGVLAAFVQD